MRGSRNTEERFWTHVDKSAGPYACWPWTSTVTRPASGGSRPVFSMGGRQRFAYHYAFEFLLGPVPAGLQICHSCDNGLCCNPIHLWSGTQADNMADMWAKGRGLAGERAPWSKLTASTVERLRERYAGGESMRDLTDEYGVGYEYGYSIARGRSWAHVGGPRLRRADRHAMGVPHA